MGLSSSSSKSSHFSRRNGGTKEINPRKDFDELIGVSSSTSESKNSVPQKLSANEKQQRGKSKIDKVSGVSSSRSVPKSNNISKGKTKVGESKSYEFMGLTSSASESSPLVRQKSDAAGRQRRETKFDSVMGLTSSPQESESD